MYRETNTFETTGKSNKFYLNKIKTCFSDKHKMEGHCKLFL